MNRTLGIALIAFVPASVLLFAAWLRFRHVRSGAYLLQLIGTASLMIVVLAHLCEGIGFLPVMGWGGEQTIGHYLDLSAAIVGLTLFPLGYLLGALLSE